MTGPRDARAGPPPAGPPASPPTGHRAPAPPAPPPAGPPASPPTGHGAPAPPPPPAGQGAPAPPPPPGGQGAPAPPSPPAGRGAPAQPSIAPPSRRAFGPLPRPGRGGVVLAVFVVALLGWITLNTVRSDSPGSLGLPAGARLPAFAVPLSGSPCRGSCDADIATRARQGAAGSKPACEVRGRYVVNSCELAAAAPAVLAFVFAPVGACRDELDVLARARARHPGVRFAAVAVRADGARARGLARAHLGVPIAYDHDGAVADEYAVVVCPTITFIRRGGRVAGSTVGPLGSAGLERWLTRID